jgi:ankyrin repeat protein
LFPSSQSRFGWTALHFAAFRGRLKVANFLLSNNADVNIKVRLNEINDVTRFIEIRVSFFAWHQEENERTALHLAAETKHEDIAELLINSGSSVEAKVSELWSKRKRSATTGEKADAGN